MLASDEDMLHLTRAQDGSFRQGTHRPIAQALVTGVCLDHILPAVRAPSDTAGEIRQEGTNEIAQVIHLLSINVGSDSHCEALRAGGGGDVLDVLEGAKALLSAGRVRAVALRVGSAQSAAAAMRMLHDAGYCFARSFCPGVDSLVIRTPQQRLLREIASDFDAASLPVSCEEATASRSSDTNVHTSTHAPTQTHTQYRAPINTQARTQQPASQSSCDDQEALYFLRRNYAATDEPRNVSTRAPDEIIDTMPPSYAGCVASWCAKNRSDDVAEEGRQVSRQYDGVAGDVQQVLQQYQEMHANMVDPDDTSEAKRFLVLRSGHGMGIFIHTHVCVCLNRYMYRFVCMHIYIDRHIDINIYIYMHI